MKLILIFCIFFSAHAIAKDLSNQKFLIINSYDENFPWTKIINETFIKNIKAKFPNSQFRIFYLDEKRIPIEDKVSHPQKNNILKTISTWHPNLILVTDDYALNQFSVNLSQMNIPFVFSGINGDLPEVLNKETIKFSGVYERYYIKSSIELLKRVLKKRTINVLFLLEDSETSPHVEKSIHSQLKVSNIKYRILRSNSFEEWKKSITTPTKMDAFFPIQPFGLRENKYPIQTEKVIQWITKNSKKPTIYTSGWQIRCGGTLAIVQRPESQAITAAELSWSLLKEGKKETKTPLDGDIEINYQNATNLKLSIPLDILAAAKISKLIEAPCSPIKKGRL